MTEQEAIETGETHARFALDSLTGRYPPSRQEAFDSGIDNLADTMARYGAERSQNAMCAFLRIFPNPRNDA